MVHSSRLRLRPRLLGKPPRLGPPRSRISGTMSANAIVQRYPETETLFRQLRVDREREGYESVEELAWRRGMDEHYFLKQLRQVAKVFPGSRVIQE